MDSARDSSDKRVDDFAMALSGIALAASAAINGFSAADGFPEVGTSGYDHRAV